jgi:hypothetical protein
MEIVLTTAAAITGAVLVASGVLKLGRTAAFHETLGVLGVPGFLRRTTAFATVFPWIEIATGASALVLPSPAHHVPLVVAALMHLVFVIVSIRALRAPEPVECECFGGLGDARMTPLTVVRNTTLLLLAVLGALAATSPWSSAAPIGVPWLPLAVTAVVVAALVVVRDRGAARAAETAPVAPVVAAPPAPLDTDEDLAFTTVDGDRIPLSEYRDPATHLVFFSPGCSSCHALVGRYRWWPHGLRPGDELQHVFLGTPAEFAAIEVFAPLAPYALYDEGRVIAKRLGLRGTPGHVHIDEAHPLGSGWTAGTSAIEAAVLRPGFFDELQADGAAGGAAADDGTPATSA